MDKSQDFFFNLVPFSKECMKSKVCVQGVVALGGHFATLCREVYFHEVFFFRYYFSEGKGQYFNTFNHSYSEKSSNRAT